MTFVKVNKLPEPKKRQYKNMYDELIRFMDTGIKIAKVCFDGDAYANTNTGYTSFYNTIKRNRFPIIATVINGDIYLIRSDL